MAIKFVHHKLWFEVEMTGQLCAGHCIRQLVVIIEKLVLHTHRRLASVEQNRIRTW